MTTTLQALYSFFSSFDIPAFPESDIPDDPPKPGEGNLYDLPYITYQIVEPERGENAIYRARVWYRSEGYAGISKTVDAIQNAIGEGVKLDTERGFIMIYPMNPFMQFMPIIGTDVKCAVLTMMICNYQY